MLQSGSALRLFSRSSPASIVKSSVTSPILDCEIGLPLPCWSMLELSVPPSPSTTSEKLIFTKWLFYQGRALLEA